MFKRHTYFLNVNNSSFLLYNDNAFNSSIVFLDWSQSTKQIYNIYYLYFTDKSSKCHFNYTSHISPTADYMRMRQIYMNATC